MPTIKNVGGHVDDLHDGRPIARFATATVTAEQLDLAHYQTRISDGRILVVPDGDTPVDPLTLDDAALTGWVAEHSIPDVVAAADGEPARAARLLAVEGDPPRKGLVDQLKPLTINPEEN